MNKMIEKFKNENIALHCNTQEEYDELMRLLGKYDFRWTSGLKTTFPNYFEELAAIEEKAKEWEYSQNGEDFMY